MRKAGYYWVKLSDQRWFVAYWCDGHRDWTIIVNDKAYQDSFFEEIDETKIERK